jgi:HEAT repeat protein
LTGILSLALLQPNGCSSGKEVKADVANQARATPTPAATRDKQKGEQDKMDLLREKVLAKDLGAEDLARQMGKSAIPVLEPLAANSDADVRMIALSSLNYVGDEGVVDILINALKDETPTVSVEGVRGLERYLSPSIYPKLLAVYDDVGDPTRRKDIALMLGKIEGAKIADLKQKDENEKDAEAKEGLLVALARLDDLQAKQEFLSRLHAAKSTELKRFLDHVEYIGKTWAIRGLEPVLSDKTDLVWIGIDGEEGPESLRACDVAVNLINKVMAPKFSFQVRGNKNYAEPELQQVRGYLNTLR